MSMGTMIDSGSDFSSSENEDNANIFSRCPESEPDIPSAVSDYELPKQSIISNNKNNEVQTPSKDRTSQSRQFPEPFSSQTLKGDESMVSTGIEPSSDIQIDYPAKSQSPKRQLENDTSDLMAFDFLDAPKKNKKQRNTHYHKVKVVTDDDNDDESNDDIELPAQTAKVQQSMDKVLENVEHFLNSLDTQSEHSINDIFEIPTEDKSSLGDISNGHRVYNARRTLLLDKNRTEEDEERDMVSDYLDEIEDKTKASMDRDEPLPKTNANTKLERNNGSYNFNELKNIGKSLEYKEDFEYLTADLKSNTPTNRTITILCELILAFSNDSSFKDYIEKSHSNDVCKWCLQSSSCDSEELLLLQGFILNTFPFDYMSLKTTTRIDDVLTNLAKCKVDYQSSAISNKLQRMTYNNFLKVNKQKSGITHAFQVWHKIISTCPGFNGRDLLNILFENINSSSGDDDALKALVFELLEMIISRGDILEDLVATRNGYEQISDLLKVNTSHNIEDQNYLKCLIHISKDPLIIDKVDHSELSRLVELCVIQILDHFEKTNNMQSDDKTTLQLGLCMNIIEHIDSHMDRNLELWERLNKVITNNTSITNDQALITGLVYLIFAHLTLLTNDKVYLTERSSDLIERLNQVQKVCASVNATLGEKLCIAINKLKAM